MHVLLGEGIFNVDGSVNIVFREEGIKLFNILSQASIDNRNMDMQVL